jgi:signal transduction histidine kinase
VDNLQQRLKALKTSLETIQKLSPKQQRSLIEALADLTYTVKALPVTTDEESLEHQSSQWRETLIEEQAAALSQANQQLTQLNSDLEQQVQAHSFQLDQMLRFEAMLKRITDKVRDSLDESYILQTALQELTDVLGIEGCDTALYDAQETTSTISYESGTRGGSNLGRVTLIAEFPEEYTQLQQGHCFQFCQFLPALQRPITILACPILDEQGALGHLLLFKPQEEHFEEREIRLVQQVANQCAIAIHQARLYQAAQAQVTELERLNQLKDDFLSTVSHELRTPITNMKMAIHMLSRTLEQNQSLFAEMKNPDAQRSKVTRYFQILLNECERETHLIDDLLDLQRLETGRQPFLPSSIQLCEWLPPLLEPFEQRTQSRQQRFETDIAPNLPLLICDSASLERVLTELLNNACKYTPPHETIKLTIQAQGECLQLSVCNTGVEISRRDQSRIFDKFYRIPKADRWQQGGTGLGLALVQKLVTRLSGTIQVESGSGQTCFTVVLPLKVSGLSTR